MMSLATSALLTALVLAGCESPATQPARGSATSIPPSVSGQSPAEPSGAQADLVACGTGLLCPTVPTCWGTISNLSGQTTAQRAACDETHYWETFLAGRLPDDVAALSPSAAMKRPESQQLCTRSRLTERSVDAKRTNDWVLGLLPVKQGEGWLFHCVARPADGRKHADGAAFRTGA